MNRYASVIAIESPSKVDDEQWLAYWIIYSFLTLMEMLLQPVLEWYDPRKKHDEINTFQLGQFLFRVGFSPLLGYHFGMI